MKKKRQQNTQSNDERGVVSIIVTLVLMLIISIVVVGFARLTRREQRQALDRQLSTQAYYAAETAVNDTIKRLDDTVAPVDQNQDYTDDCNEFIALYSLSSQIDGASGTVSYPCLFVDPSPTTLEYTSIGLDSSKVIPLKDKAGTPINEVFVRWEDKGGGSNMAGCGAANPTVLPPATGAGAWDCDTGMMRVEIVEIPPPAPAAITRDSLADSTMTVFLFPSTAPAASTIANYTANKGFGNQGKIIGASCNNPPGLKRCNFKFTGLSGTNYVMRLKSIYRSSTVMVQANNGGYLELVGAQTLIDATGKANDVLRRIQVRIPTPTFNSPFPEAGLQTGSNLCKRFAWAPPDVYRPDLSAYPECNVIN